MEVLSHHRPVDEEEVAALSAAAGPAGLAKKPTIGVLAIQGAFAEHRDILRELGATVREVSTPHFFVVLDADRRPGPSSTA